MQSSKKLMLVLGLLLVASMVLAACQPAPTAEPETIVETVVVTVETEGETIIQEVTVTPVPEEMPTTLVACIAQEPETLYIWGNSMLAMSHIHEGVMYDGPIDNRSFGYQPIILEKLPSLADGDAVINEVTATDGDTVVDAEGNVIVLDGAAGQKIKVAGSEEAVDYTGGEVTMEQLVVTFVMLPDLKWSDGEPMTSADSIYGFNVQADPDTTTGKFTIERTASYEATDDVTNVWAGLPGYKDSTYFLNFFTPLPEHVWGGYTAAELLTAVDADIPNMLVGFGPYRALEWNKGDSVRAEKNPNYFRADEGLPKFDEVVFRFIGENSNANIAAVLSGECDIVDQSSGLDDQSELLLELQASGQINPTFVTGTVWEHVDFGIQHISYDDGYQAGSDRYDFFSDLRVRQGLLHCMDRQAVVDTVTFGQSIVIDAYIPPNHPLYNSEITSYAYDPEAGMALLAEAGWTDTDGDGILDKDGQPFSVAYETTTAAYRAQVTQIIADSLKGCGIDAQLTYYPASEWFADGPDGKLFGRRFDLGEFAWLTGVEPPCDLYLSNQTPGDPAATWVSIQEPDTGERTFPSGWGGQNDPGFANAEYDVVCQTAIGTLPGTPEYEQAHKEAQALFADNLPVAPLFLRLKLAATRPDMCEFFMDPTANSEFWNIENFGFGPLCQ